VPAYLVSGAKPERVITSTEGVPDAIIYDGTVKLSADGSAKIQLVLTFHGKYAMLLRKAFSEVPESQLRGVLETRLLGQALQGARLLGYKMQHFDDPDSPLTISMQSEMSNFAQPSGDSLIVSPPFTPSLSQLATLPERETPLLIAEATDHRVRLSIEAPPGTEVQSSVQKREIRDGARRVTISDLVKDNVLVLDRAIALPAGRIQPEEYRRFVEFARHADSALSGNIRLRVR
jgi:hypothetical protein